MTIGSNMFWFILVVLAAAVLVTIWLRRSRPFMRLSQRIADRAFEVLEARSEEDRATRKQRAERRKQTAAERIESLKVWRNPFVSIVRRFAEPVFAEWHLGSAVLDRWSEEQADIYIRRKPYILQVIQWIHADAPKAAESFAKTSQKSTGEIARERAKVASGTLVRNPDCPYCEKLLPSRAPVDHIVSVQRNGPSEHWNMVYCCVRCNHAKGKLSLEEFANTEYARSRGIELNDIVQRLTNLGKVHDVLDAEKMVGEPGEPARSQNGYAIDAREEHNAVIGGSDGLASGYDPDAGLRL